MDEDRGLFSKSMYFAQDGMLTSPSPRRRGTGKEQILRRGGKVRSKSRKSNRRRGKGIVCWLHLLQAVQWIQWSSALQKSKQLQDQVRHINMISTKQEVLAPSKHVQVENGLFHQEGGRRILESSDVTETENGQLLGGNGMYGARGGESGPENKVSTSFHGDSFSNHVKIETYLYSTVVFMGMANVTIEVFTNEVNKSMIFKAFSDALKKTYEFCLSNNTLTTLRKIAEDDASSSPTQSNNSVGPNTKPPVERDSRLAEKIARKLKLQLVDRRLRLVLIGWNPRKYEKKMKKQTDREEQELAARKIQAIQRGKIQRKELQEQQKAALNIQSKFRGAKARSEVKNRREQAAAALKIQLLTEVVNVEMN